MSINLDNLKTYYQFDQSETYKLLSKFPRHFENGYQDALSLTLERIPSQYSDFCILTSGKDEHLANFVFSLSPFFLKIPFSISTSPRIPIYLSNDSLILRLFSDENITEAKSTKLELEAKKVSSLSFQYHSPAHTCGFLLGLLSRFDQHFSKTIDFDKVFAATDEAVSKLLKEVTTKNNPAKALGQKHSQRAVLFFAANHLLGVSNFASGLVIRQAKTFSNHYQFPDVSYLSESLFTYPTKVLYEYQVILLNSDLYPNNIKSEIADFKQLLSQKRINYTEIKPDSLDWFSQIAETVVFFNFFSYYLSITNKIII